jgi:hypothetical protein
MPVQKAMKIFQKSECYVSLLGIKTEKISCSKDVDSALIYTTLLLLRKRVFNNIDETVRPHIKPAQIPEGPQ